MVDCGRARQSKRPTIRHGRFAIEFRSRSDFFSRPKFSLAKFRAFRNSTKFFRLNLKTHTVQYADDPRKISEDHRGANGIVEQIFE